MKAIQRYLCALLLVLACVPVLADDCPAIQALTANDVQTGEPVTIEWSYTGGGPQLQLQTLTGHDFAAPIVLGPNVRSYTYVPSKPGEKHVQIAATTACGTVSISTTYHVQQCNVVAPPITVDRTSVEPGAVIHASVKLKPGHTVRWEVINGTASSTTGSAILVTAGDAGAVTINAWVSRGSSCSDLSSATVQVVSSCPIVEPTVYHPEVATASNWFYLFVDVIPPGHTLAFAVHGAQVDFQDEQGIYVTTPAQGSFSIDVILSNGTCSRTFTYTFTVEACSAAAVVRPGASTGGCGATTAIAEFSGVPPFQGGWSDGQYFFTYDSSIERPIAGGTFTLAWFYDNYCEGTITGSATGGSSLAPPVFTIDPIIDGLYYGNDTCPGLLRTARLDGDVVPAGATVEWSLYGGSIVSGQGTAVVQYVANEPGMTNLTAVFTDAAGCETAPTVEPYGQTNGEPTVSVRVEPSVIPAGGTAIVTVDRLSPYVRGEGVTSSLGDTIVPLGYEGKYEYRSANGGGVATITVRGTNACETYETSTTLTIDGSHPLPATATVQAIGNDCATWEAYAQLTGVPPYTGTWSNGETFVSDYPYVFLRPPTGGTYTLTAFADANAPGTVTGSATFDFVGLAKPAVSLDTESACPNAVVTATLDAPLPAGGVATWWINGGEIISGDGTATVQIRAAQSGWVSAIVSVSAPGACSPYSDYKQIPIQGYVQQPNFYAYPIFVGGSTTFDVTLDPNTETWGFESSFGDTMEIAGNPQPNVYTIRYTSTHGTGDATIRIYGTTKCGLPFEGTRVIQIIATPPTASFTSTPGTSCGTNVTVTFTGTPPFSGTWIDGQTFSTNEYTLTRFFTTDSWAGISQLSDANGGPYFGGGIYPEYKYPEYVPIYGGQWELCPGTQRTVTAQLPEGWTIQWRVTNPNIRIVSGETSASVVIEPVSEGYADLNPIFRTPDGCESFGDFGFKIPAPQGPPVITLPVTTIQAGQSFEFTAKFDGTLQGMGAQSSLGDPITVIAQDYNTMTFTFRYDSQNGPGTATIHVHGITTCSEEVGSTATLTIEP